MMLFFTPFEDPHSSGMYYTLIVPQYHSGQIKCMMLQMKLSLPFRMTNNKYDMVRSLFKFAGMGVIVANNSF